MKVKTFFIIISMIFGVNILLIPIKGVPTNDNQLSRWRIQEWNDNIAVAWEWPSTFFMATTGSSINYTLSNYEPTNFTHPSAGAIEIGNLTTQTTNNKSAEVLLLSIYGWFPGLVTSANDWSLQEQVAKEAAQGQWTLGVLKVSESIYEINGLSRNAINFSYIQDLSVGNQNTTLIYDKATGVLLEGNSVVQFLYPYVLRLKLTYSDLISKSNVTSWSSISILSTLIVIGLIPRLVNKRR